MGGELSVRVRGESLRGIAVGGDGAPVAFARGHQWLVGKRVRDDGTIGAWIYDLSKGRVDEVAPPRDHSGRALSPWACVARVEPDGGAGLWSDPSGLLVRQHLSGGACDDLRHLPVGDDALAGREDAAYVAAVSPDARWHIGAWSDNERCETPAHVELTSL